MLRKKENFTVITPIPGFIPRQLAIDILHSHSEVITLNPLVLDHKPIKAPRDAAADEFYSTWYEITERIQYIPGVGKLGSGKINFNGCFHDMPWGLQTHIYAPMNVDLKSKYRIGGNQPGVESPEHQEIGLAALGAPSDGLYLREDIEIKCNVAVVGFVKNQMKAASKEMVQRMIKKAELLDAGVLQAMIEDGKLRTINPADRTNTIAASPQPSPNNFGQFPQNPLSSPRMPYQIPRPGSSRPGTATSYQAAYGTSHTPRAELQGPAKYPSPPPPEQQNLPIEMPGDFYHPQPSPNLQPPQPSPTFPHSNRSSLMSTASLHSRTSQDPRWSHTEQSQASSRPTSIDSAASHPAGGGVGGGWGSPPPEHKSFAQELPTHRETPEEDGYVRGDTEDLKPDGLRKYSYNPQDYARVGGSPPQKHQQQMPVAPPLRWNPDTLRYGPA